MEAEITKCAAPSSFKKDIQIYYGKSLFPVQKQETEGGRYLLGMLKFFCVCMVSWLDMYNNM